MWVNGGAVPVRTAPAAVARMGHEQASARDLGRGLRDRIVSIDQWWDIHGRLQRARPEAVSDTRAYGPGRRCAGGVRPLARRAADLRMSRHRDGTLRCSTQIISTAQNFCRHRDAGLSIEALASDGRSVKSKAAWRLPPDRPHEHWSGRRDSNSRPTGPKPVALPGCATPRLSRDCSQRPVREPAFTRSAGPRPSPSAWRSPVEASGVPVRKGSRAVPRSAI